MKTLRRYTDITHPPQGNDWSRSNNGGNYAYGQQVETIIAPIDEIFDGPCIAHPVVLAYHMANKMETIGEKAGKVYFRLISEWCSSEFCTCAICGRFDQNTQDGICRWCHPDFHWHEKE